MSVWGLTQILPLECAEMQNLWGLPMSEDDKIMAAGRVALERREAKHQLSLTKSNISATLNEVLILGKLLKPGLTENYQSAISTIDDMIRRGGLEQIKAEIERSISLSARIAELGED
jgi:hypothetical protein